MPDKTYNEDEVAKIFKRAAELESIQTDSYDSPDGRTGLHLDELSQIAIDAGLDPENVRRAAAELSASPNDNSQTTAVKNNEVISEQWVHGKFTSDIADLVIADLNHRYNATHEKTNWMDNIMHDASIDPDQQSNVKRTGKSLEWQKMNEYGTEEVRVLIQPRNDQIRIRVAKKNVYGTAFANTDKITGSLPYIPYVAGVVMLFALPGSLLFSAIFALLTFFILRFILSKNSGWIKKTLSDSKNNSIEKYRNEVQSVARDLASLIGEPPPENKDASSTDSEQEIRTDINTSYDTESGRTRKRDRS